MWKKQESCFHVLYIINMNRLKWDGHVERMLDYLFPKMFLSWVEDEIKIKIDLADQRMKTSMMRRRRRWRRRGEG